MCRVTLGFGHWGRRKTPPLLAPQVKPFPPCGSLSCPPPPSHHSTPPGSDVCGETPAIAWFPGSSSLVAIKDNSLTHHHVV